MFIEFSVFIPKWVKEAGLFPPKSISSVSELQKLQGFEKCWIAQNLANFDKKASPNKPYSSRRKIIRIYLGIDPQQIRVHSCCQHPLCINPTHLKVQRLKAFIPPSEVLPVSPGKKLSEADVKEIKQLLFNSDLTNRQIAQKFKVSPVTISQILCGKTWKEI